MPVQRSLGLRGRIRAIGPQAGAVRASASGGAGAGQLLSRLGGAIQGATRAGMSRLPSLYTSGAAGSAGAARGGLSVLRTLATNPRAFANPWTAAATGVLALGAGAAYLAGRSGGSRTSRGSASSAGLDFNTTSERVPPAASLTPGMSLYAGKYGRPQPSAGSTAATPPPTQRDNGGGALRSSGGGGSSRPSLPLGSGNPPGFGPTATGTTAAQNRASERLRMEQQYAKPEFWSTDAGKGMLDLAANQRAPMNANLPDYYAAQRAVGVGAKEQIAEAVSGGRADLKAWALANPDLAYREYLKRNPEQASQLLRPDDNSRLMTAPMKTDPTEVFSGGIGGGSQLAGTAVTDAPAWPGNGMSDDQLRAAYSGAMDFRPNAPVDLARAQLSGAPLDAITGKIGNGELITGAPVPGAGIGLGSTPNSDLIAAQYQPGTVSLASSTQPGDDPAYFQRLYMQAVEESKRRINERVATGERLF